MYSAADLVPQLDTFSGRFVHFLRSTSAHNFFIEQKQIVADLEMLKSMNLND